MKILLLLVVKCLTHSKISAVQNQIHQLQQSDIISAPNGLLDEGLKPNQLRVKRDLSRNEFLSFGLEGLDRSPRRKREVRNQNQIFFRRRKKKLQRKSKIRRSLLRRGKFTTATPYSHMKKYIRGKGKVIKPPGLKYRKKYRFNRFKKTQDVALGIGDGGRAKFLKSPPKKRPPIHVRDYERGRGTRKALRGRGGERKSRDDNERFRKGADTDRKRARATAKKSDKQYYDEFSDYSSELAKDSLARQTKARKAHSTSGTKRKKSTKSASKHSSNDDNTLLLSDEEQLTDVSSDISDLRSELPDERPKHRKNASSSEYEQYSYAEDDSAIVSGEVVASQDESSPLKTTLLGPINYDQYDIKKLDASVERVFKKSKKQKADADYDDPFENIEDGYKDETSYESSSDTKQRKQKVQKSKLKLEKRPDRTKPQSKTANKPKAKFEKKQTPRAKFEKDVAKSDSYDDEDYSKETKKQKEGQPESKLEKNDEDAEEYETEDENGEEYGSKGKDEEGYNSQDKDEKEKDSDDEYTSDDEYIYEEPSTPKRRIPTWKRTQDPMQEKLYEEYTDSKDQEKKPKLPSSKTSSKKKLATKKGDETHEEYESEYSDNLQSQYQNQRTIKPDTISIKHVKSTTQKTKKLDTAESTETSDYESESYSEDYSDTDYKSESYSEDYSDTDYKSEYYSEHYSDTDESSQHDSIKITPKRISLKSGKVIENVASDGKHTKKRNKSEKGPDDYSNVKIKSSKQTMKTPKKGLESKKNKNASTNDEYKEYEAYYSDEDNEKEALIQTTKNPPKLSPIKKTTSAKKDPKSEKIKISTYESKEYNSEISNDESSHSEKTTKKLRKSQETFKPSLILRITKSNKVIDSKSTLNQLFTTKKSLSKTSKKKPSLKKSSEMYEDSEYDSQVTSYEESYENATEENPEERITWLQDDIVERATWPKEALKQSVPLETLGYKTLYNDSEEKAGSADQTASTITTLLRKAKSAPSTLKRTKKGFTTLPPTTKGFNSEEALKKISSKVAAMTQKHVFVYNTKRKAYELVSIQPISSATLELTVSPKQPPNFLKSTFVTNLYTSDNSSMSHLTGKTLKKRIVYKKTTVKAGDNLLESTSHISADHLGAEQSVVEDQTKKTTRKRISRKTVSARSNITQKRSRKKTTVTESPAEEETPS